MKRSTAKKQSVLIALCCLTLAAVGFSAKAPKKFSLRFPFGLTPSTTLETAKTQLQKKGLTFEGEKTVGSQLFASWGLSGQLDFQQFAPRNALAVFEKNQLSSFSMAVGPIAECGAAQPVFLSALDLVRSSYDPEESPVTEEPAADALDCGPYFKSESYKLRSENKKFVCTVVPTRDSNGYRITLTYYVRPSTRPSEDPDAPKDTPKNLRDNL
jgi:hypothetical protein